MIIFHDKNESNMNLDFYIQNHSADEIVDYKIVDGEKISLGLFYPPDMDKTRKYPVFVITHGGGWASHKIFPEQRRWCGDYLGFLARYYAEKGFVAVSIDYRLMRDNGQTENYGLIDLYDDCLDAVTYLMNNSDKYGIDFDNSVILGESAGGWLAAALANFDFKAKPVFKTAILVNSITDLTDLHWRKAVPDNITENKYLKDLTFGERKLFLSPVSYINSSTCPTLLIHGTDDSCVRPRHSVAFYDEMQAAHNDCELHFINDTNHAFLLAEYFIEKNKEYAAAITGIKIIDNWLVKQDFK